MQVWHVDSSRDSVYCIFLYLWGSMKHKFGMLTVHEILYIVCFCVSVFLWFLDVTTHGIYIVVMETSDIITIPTTWTSIIIVLQGKVHPDFVQNAKGSPWGLICPCIIYSIIPHHITPWLLLPFDTYCTINR